jgi:hypothetical protein
MKGIRGMLVGVTVSTIAASFIVAQDAAPSIDRTIAAQYFAEARELCNRDGGKLWGHSLNGPILLVSPATREVIANQADLEGKLAKSGDVFVGKLPADMLVANTAIDWAGVKWTMVMLPFPRDQSARRVLLAHELWHRVQDEIGFPSSGAANHHLDTRDGRLWLQLEWRALAVALLKNGKLRQDAISDALLFRSFRRTLIGNAAEEERAMEMHEGLAEYTGVALSGSSDLPQYVVDHNLTDVSAKPTFIRSFAYASGPAYGILLDQSGSDWRKGLKKTDDLGALLQMALRLQAPTDLAQSARGRAQNYGWEKLAAVETEREENRQKLLATYRRKFIDDPVLVIPLQEMKMQFDPGELVSLDPRGTVYPNIKIVDTWGILTDSNGALLESDFGKITVSAPTDSRATSVKGEGWTLELNPGWELEAATRTGDQTIGRRKK